MMGTVSRRKIIDRIVEIFNEGQDNYYIIYNGEVTDSYLVFNSYNEWELSLDDDTKWCGFLINREFGFAEAWVRRDNCYFEKEEVPNMPCINGLGGKQSVKHYIEKAVEGFIIQLALAEKKWEWLGENL